MVYLVSVEIGRKGKAIPIQTVLTVREKIALSLMSAHTVNLIAGKS